MLRDDVDGSNGLDHETLHSVYLKGEITFYRQTDSRCWQTRWSLDIKGHPLLSRVREDVSRNLRAFA